MPKIFFQFWSSSLYIKVASFWKYLSNFLFIPFGRLFWNFACFRAPSHLAATLKQAKIQKSLPKDMKNKFEIYYQKLATLHLPWLKHAIYCLQKFWISKILQHVHLFSLNWDVIMEVATKVVKLSPLMCSHHQSHSRVKRRTKFS